MEKAVSLDLVSVSCPADCLIDEILRRGRYLDVARLADPAKDAERLVGAAAGSAPYYPDCLLDDVRAPGDNGF
jgi:hypothetical protein